MKSQTGIFTEAVWHPSAQALSSEQNRADVDAWVVRVYRLRLAYLQYIRLRGYKVPDSQIAALRSDVRAAGSPGGPLEAEVAELQDLLGYIDSVESNGGSTTKATLHKLGFVKLQMRPEANHGRPHFHIEYKREHSASYAADTLERLAGSMPKKYEVPMMAWAETHQAELLETWKRMNAGEDVRELVVLRNT